MLTGIIEEVAKLAIVAFILLRNKKMKYALNGLLVGAAIGAGFAAFESAGYAFRIFLNSLLGSQLNVAIAYDQMMDNIILRAFLAPGGHVIWAAMSGYAVMLVKKSGDNTFFLNQKAFWRIFWIPILLHAVWDMPIALSDTMVGALAPICILILLGWVVTFVFIGNSLEQIGHVVKGEIAAEQAPTEEKVV
jgi:RsiW-degrading membrane proteinase PrsW (M82 family)